MPIKTFRFDVEGGKATAGPPIGPSLTPLGLNVLAVVERINELTSEFRGMRVPVKVRVNTDTKEFDVEVGIPTVSALIAKEAQIEKGSGEPGRKAVANLTMEQVVKIARMKMPHMRVNSLRAAVKTVLGVCVSMGVNVDGKNPKEVLRELEEGVHEGLLGEAATA
ncbi:MAG: 50S ribosomal protein L11 [Thaumarchaeota archaeon]|nr:50S ribosomal protein L11 [Candidatus Calditenuaceae archaeon]MDW8042922.1 50S ribosomal protein L11 [Nitrososphaerota archaeon]